MKFKSNTINNPQFERLSRELKPKTRILINKAFKRCSPLPTEAKNLFAERASVHAENQRILQARRRLQRGLEYFTISANPWITAYNGKIRGEKDPEPTFQQKLTRTIQAFTTGRLETLIPAEQRRSKDFNEHIAAGELIRRLETCL